MPLSLRAVVKNAGWLSLIQVLNYAIPALTLPVVTRAFGPNIYGILAVLNAFATYVGVLTSYGFNIVGPRAIIASRECTIALSKTVSAFITAQFVIGVFATSLFCAGVSFGPFDQELQLVASVVAIQAATTSLAPQWVFIGLERMRHFALVQLIARGVASALILILIRYPDDLLLYVSINCIAAVSIFILSLIALHRYGIHWYTPAIGAVWSVVAQASRLFFSTASISLYTTTNVIIVAFIVGPVGAGAFALADRVRVVAGTLIAPLTDAFYPFVCRIAGRRETHQEGWVKRFVFRSVIILATMISLALFAFAPFIIWLVGGNSFEESVPVLRILAFLPFIIALSNTFGKQTMLPLRMDREYTWVVFYAAMLAPISAFVFTWLLGLTGAALTLLLVEIYVTVSFAIVVHQRIDILSLFFRRQSAFRLRG